LSEAEPSSRLLVVARLALVLGTLAALGYFAFELVAISFRLNARTGIRSAVGVALPLLGAGYALSADQRERIPRGPTAARVAASCAAGALALAVIPHFLALLPLPVAELGLASCAAVLAVAARRALDPSHAGSGRSLALFVGVAAGMLGYVAIHGLPRVVPG
jgi:hypothetical protein